MIRIRTFQVASEKGTRRKPSATSIIMGILGSFIALLLFFGFAVSAKAQLYTGSVSGAVVDSSGAVIAEADLTLMDEERGFSVTAKSDSAGRYLFRNVTPSIYKLTVKAAGFKDEARSGIKVAVNQNVAQDFSMQVHSADYTVEVKAAPPALSTQDAVTGQVVDRKFINDLPLNGRDVLGLAYLAPGVTWVDAACPGCSQNNFVANGGRNATADILMDGVTTTNYEQNSGIRVDTYTPSVEAVEEFKVQESNFSAEFGFTGATVINLVTRSGTNAFHGSGYEFLRNSKLDANSWFNNHQGIPIAPLRSNVFGTAFGGPIRKNKTFFFFDYEGRRNTSADGPIYYGVPSAAERQGDFGETCAAKGGTFDSAGQCSEPAGQLWDPYSGTYDSAIGGPRRQVFIPFNNLATYTSTTDASHPGNQVLATNPDGAPYRLPSGPGNLIDPVAHKLMQYFPLPNMTNGNPYTNRVDSGWAKSSSNQWDLKIDHHFSQNNLFSGKYSQNGGSSTPYNVFGNIADPRSSGHGKSSAHLLALNDTHTFNSTTLLTISYGGSRGMYFFPSITGDFPQGTDPVALLGEPDYMRASGYNWFPAVSVGGYSSAGSYNNIGTELYSYAKLGQETHHLIGTLSWVKKAHELKFGAEGRMHRLNYTQPNYAPGGYYSFDQSGTGTPDSACVPSDEVSCPSIGGDGMASFLVGGEPQSWGMYEVPNSVATQNFEAGGFVQDTWKATSKLTLNLGLRYEVVLPRTDRLNQMNWLDPNVESPITLYGQHLRGGEMFTDSNHRTNYDPDLRNFQPRIGFAYRAMDKTVLRGGYGIYYSAWRGAVAGTSGVGLQGYDQLSYPVSSFWGDGATPAARMSNPFPNGGPTLPPGRSLGLLNDVGYGGYGPIRSISNKVPYEQSWTFGIQRELPGDLVLDVSYIGKKGTHLYFSNAGSLNHLGPEVEHYTQAQIADLNTFVDNPFADPSLSNASQLITDPNNPLLYSQIQKLQLQLPYPQFSGFAGDEPPYANSIYHGLQVRAEKRFSHGLEFLVTYTFSKSIDDASLTSTNSGYLGSFASLQNPNRPEMERSLSSFDVPQVLQFSYTYELPIGRGKMIGNSMGRVLNAVVGGWRTNGIWRFSSGLPLIPGLYVSQSLPTYGPQRPNLIGRPSRNRGSKSSWIQQYFTTADGSDFLAQPAAYTLGTAPRTLGSVRQPGENNADMSLFKEFSLASIHEGMRMEYRFETFNSFNHPQFCGPDVTFGTPNNPNPNFGKIYYTCNSPREVQMALKLYW